MTPTKTATELGAALKAWRGERTQAQAATRLRANLATYRNWEAGRRRPTGGHLAFIREVIEREGREGREGAKGARQ